MVSVQDNENKDFLSLWLEGCYSEAALFGVLCDAALIYGCKDCCCCSWAAWDDVGCPVGGGGGGGCTPACVLGEGGGVGRLNLSGLLLLLGEGLCGVRKDNGYTKSSITCHGMTQNWCLDSHQPYIVQAKWTNELTWHHFEQNQDKIKFVSGVQNRMPKRNFWKSLFRLVNTFKLPVYHV